MVSTALGPSRLWVTVGHGVINEVYWPTTGKPQIRDPRRPAARDGRAVEGPAGIWGVVFEAAELEAKTELNFTHRAEGGWEGQDHRVSLGHSQLEHKLMHVTA